MQNATEVLIPCTPKRSVYVVGDLATNPPKKGARLQGILVQRTKYGDPSVMAPKDLGLYTKVATARLLQRQVMRLQVPFEKCRLALELMFEGIDATQSLGGIECLAADGARRAVCARVKRSEHAASTALSVEPSMHSRSCAWVRHLLGSCISAPLPARASCNKPLHPYRVVAYPHPSAVRMQRKAGQSCMSRTR